MSGVLIGSLNLPTWFDETSSDEDEEVGGSHGILPTSLPQAENEILHNRVCKIDCRVFSKILMLFGICMWAFNRDRSVQNGGIGLAALGALASFELCSTCCSSSSPSNSAPIRV